VSLTTSPVLSRPPTCAAAIPLQSAIALCVGTPGLATRDPVEVSLRFASRPLQLPTTSAAISVVPMRADNPIVAIFQGFHIGADLRPSWVLGHPRSPVQQGACHPGKARGRTTLN